jgi:hypothetical protein
MVFGAGLHLQVGMAIPPDILTIIATQFWHFMGITTAFRNPDLYFLSWI